MCREGRLSIQTQSERHGFSEGGICHQVACEAVLQTSSLSTLSRPETLRRQKADSEEEGNPLTAAASWSEGTSTAKECVYLGDYTSQSLLSALEEKPENAMIPTRLIKVVAVRVAATCIHI